jgi:NAD(P)-dependent dehydrogenase (short-subunit alcohol dehydrogenase family)
MSASTLPRTVLVTGSAKRLGREIALALARGGWQVAVHYRESHADAQRTSAECAKLSGKSAIFETDLADETAVRGLLPRVVAHFGRLDAVVNSASTFEHDSAASFGFAAMEKHMRSNTGAAILLAQALHGHIMERRGDGNSPGPTASGVEDGTAHGAVVNLLDQKLWNQNPDFFSYTLSKAALEAATTMLALGLAPYTRVVGVAPGLTLTSPFIDESQFEARHKLALLEQSSTPEDVASTVRFALENRSITGTTLLVDGGQHLMRFERDFSLM